VGGFVNLVSKAILSLGAVASIGCAQSGFSNEPAPAAKVGKNAIDTGGGNLTLAPNTNSSCRTQIQSIVTPVKFLMIVDTSGSNINADGGFNATDPQKTFRGGAIQRFFNAFSAKNNFSWGFLTFANDSVQSLINVNAAAAFSSAANMNSAISLFYSTPDFGSTPFAMALDRAYAVLSLDNSADVNTKYVISFMSDGRPDPVIDDSFLRFKVQSLLALKPGKVSFNTVYYGGASAENSGRLRNMATWGQGQFFDLNASQSNTLEIADTINVPGLVCAR
jgi:hypothetical protein